MSFQAYLNNIEKKTGKIPQYFVDEATKIGFGSNSKASEIVSWLKSDYDLGHGHAMALVHVIKNGPGIGDKHVKSGGAHSDESSILRLDGLSRR